MTAEPIPFPQHATRPAEKPRSIAGVLKAAGTMTPEQALALIAAAFPQATLADLNRALGEYEARLAAEAGELDALTDVAALCAPVLESGEASTIGEALRVLADQGDERAAAYLAETAGPDQQEFVRVLELAVAEDPYWSKDDDGRYRCKPGATHTTPDELVAAYRRNHGLG